MFLKRPALCTNEAHDVEDRDYSGSPADNRQVNRAHSNAHLSELRAQLDAIGESIVLDLGDLSLVSVDVVRFLSTCESQGTQLLNCPAYIRKWIDGER